MQPQVQRDVLEVDVLIVGAGPAGLATAIHTKQVNPQLEVYVLEKGAHTGAHTISGALIDPKGLDELLPEWRTMEAPLNEKVSSERFSFLSTNKTMTVPHWLLPASFKNPDAYAGSLSELVAWLAKQAEELEVQIFSGYTAASLILESGEVKGVITGDMGITKDGAQGDRYQPGIEIRAPYTVFAEGCRGHLGRELEAQFNLRKNSDPQSYALGIKELWRIPQNQHTPGMVTHTAGWPLDTHTYGGGFIYHYGEQLVSVGFVTGLDYSNPYLNPYMEFQRWKHHPSIHPLLAQGERIAYGARTIAAGGLQALPQVIFPGGVLVGCEAGFLHAARIKGTHTAIKSGMIAASCIAHALRKEQQNRPTLLTEYPKQLRESWIYKELHATRNFKPWMAKGLIIGSLMYGFEQLVLRGCVPWTLRNKKAAHTQLQKAKHAKPINYQAVDGVVSFDLLSSVYLSNTNHEEDQPVHLHLKQPKQAIEVNWYQYQSPEQRYCPAGVYEILDAESAPKIQINAQNCLHCKACDIKDPQQNIIWKVPQGGEGPIYQGM